ncbi:glycoside hydrolase family 53 protein [Portibacter lacus]|uniref:Arabinogalactan endo-beta-1,4-galactanase n=1 Tax=Portibacter lacus TaxID=1099794 RepID=A0AA37SLL8_9BACT|nr:glycosyl hydrolase 53 family protein [Portibacter lacus]GLR15547.1 arabinogalactan endo-beta-1,4-galactanase [Portibacter lacus]
MNIRIALLLLFIFPSIGQTQSFYFGADQSYVNEMEDCGVVYKEDGVAKDVYQIYKDHGSNLVRLRLWHTPNWYDQLNSGKRYSDLPDVKKAIKRARDKGMDVLLDFHLSDNWSDPSKQLVPAVWLSVVDNLPVLQDSLYQYIYKTLDELQKEDLLPEMVQIGNETNKGILLSPQDNEGWKLDWDRNAALFNTGIKAVRDFDASIKIMIHAAGPDDSVWLMEQFHDNGVTDFDVIGISYYWAWHKPTSIEDTREIVKGLIQNYNKEVIIAETGYIWTTATNDSANNIISDTDPNYGPASPESQKQWLIDLTKEIIVAGGSGVIYWEPSWVSSGCSTQWGQGSHQEHATFFDFDNNLLEPGGIEWMEYDYGLTSSIDIQETFVENLDIRFLIRSNSVLINMENHKEIGEYSFQMIDTSGRIIQHGNLNTDENLIQLRDKSRSVIIVQIFKNQLLVASKKIIVGQ